MKLEGNNLSRSEKILLYLFEFGEGGIKRVRYEDIVVGLFKKYPHEFQLKGFPEYPDSGDIVHKPLYDFKKKGYVNAVNKVFSLTERGLELAKQLSSQAETRGGNNNDRLSRSTEAEISRIKSSEGFGLFENGERERISDNDLYDYLGVTVRTKKNAFLGRLESINTAIAELKEHDNELYKQMFPYHQFLLTKYNSVIEFFTRNS